jgi:hypothetical protein
MYAIFLHAHQKLDRAAYRHLRGALPPDSFFPIIRQILHFEGNHGPDASKLKRQIRADQPWHFVDPFNVSDVDLHGQLQQHYDRLVAALAQRDDIRAAFEAAWLAHALVDGLTPAHHYPYEAELAQLRGQSRDTRRGLVGRAYVRSNTMRESLLASVKLVGPKGLLTTHAMFEGGAYVLIEPLRLNNARPTLDQLEAVRIEGVVTVFKQLAHEIAEMGLYHRFIAGGWTLGLSRDVRKKLAPRMARMITLAWYCASREAEAKTAPLKVRPSQTQRSAKRSVKPPAKRLTKSLAKPPIKVKRAAKPGVGKNRNKAHP